MSQPPNDTTLTLSRYEPTTETWSSPSILPFQSNGLPGLTTHDGELVLLGSEPGSGSLWITRMNAFGTFEPAQFTTLQGRRASLASHGGLLYAVYYADPSVDRGEVRHTSFNGVDWGEPESIPTGFGAGMLRGAPSIVSHVVGSFDCLHVTALEADFVANTGTVWWTYACDGGGFSVPVSIVSGPISFYRYSLAASSTELLLAYPEATSNSSGAWDIMARVYPF